MKTKEDVRIGTYLGDGEAGLTKRSGEANPSFGVVVFSGKD